MKESKRKCTKCGKSPALDPSVTLYRFPRPGKTNIIRCESWARYCFPQAAWYSAEFQAKLFAEHRMLCHEHFKETSFIDFTKKTLHRFACPYEESKQFCTTSNQNPGHCVFGCDTKDVQVHDFPHPERFPEQFKLWVDVVGAPLTNLKIEDIYREKKVCHFHFADKDWNRNDNSLNASAVPSLHIPSDDGNILHLFPNPDKDLDRFTTWTNAIGGHNIISLDHRTIFELRRVCHLHFESRYHTRSKRLSANAVPTLRLSGFSIESRPKQPTQVITNRMSSDLNAGRFSVRSGAGYS